MRSRLTARASRSAATEQGALQACVQYAANRQPQTWGEMCRSHGDVVLPAVLRGRVEGSQGVPGPRKEKT